MNRLEKRFPRYSKLLRLYPESYTQKYKDQMLQTLADMLDNEKKGSVWLKTVVDLPLSLVKQNLLFVGGVMAHETPRYVKKSTMVSGLLLAPFFVFVLLNSLTSHRLYSSWFWKPWVVGTWLIIMPGLAFLLAIGTFLRWAQERKKQKHIGFIKNSLDFRRNWPMTVVAVVSIGIIMLAFGHDSVHCVVHNPVQEIRNWHSTLRCIRNG